MKEFMCIRAADRFVHSIFRNMAMIATLLLAHTSSVSAQTPVTPASGPIAKPAEGFTPGFNAGVKFEGSTGSAGSVFDLSTGVGYNFSRHFGIALGIPYYFVGTPFSVTKNNQQ